MSGIFLGVGAIALTGYSAYSSYEADKSAGQVDTATAAFNNRYDVSQAQQLDLDTIANVDTERTQESQYLSKEAAGYASSGVLATTGSALHAQLTNVGQFTKQIQQQYIDSQQKQEQYYTEGVEGIAAGAAQSSADSAAGSIALINGAASIAGMAYGDYSKGLFSGVGTGGSPAKAQITTTGYGGDFIGGDVGGGAIAGIV